MPPLVDRRDEMGCGATPRAPDRLTRGARLCIASAGTFTDELRTLAEAEGVLLLDAGALLPG